MPPLASSSRSWLKHLDPRLRGDDEVDNTTYICNGDPGDPGPAGDPGSDSDGCSTTGSSRASFLGLLLLGLLAIRRRFN